MTLHRPRVQAYRERAWDGLHIRHRMACTCGATDHVRVGRQGAAFAVELHLAEVAAPEQERCRMPRSHGCRWWDACQVCHGPALFDLSDD